MPRKTSKDNNNKTPKDNDNNNTEDDRLLFKKPCKYIGSLAVTLLNGEERQRFVNEKLLELRDVAKGIPVVFMITDEGVKVLKENESAVKMAHGITRIAFSTCQPERRLFAYVAKSLAVDKKVIIQAHMFKTKKNSHSQQLSLNLSKAFKISYARDSVRRKDRVKLFESEAEEKKVSSEIQSRGKRWAKVDQAHGHEYTSHALIAKERQISPELSKLINTLDLDQNNEVSPPRSHKVSQKQSNEAGQLTNNSNEMIDSPKLTKINNKQGNSKESSLKVERSTELSSENSNEPKKRRISKGRKISQEGNKRRISQEQNIHNNNDEVINLVSGIKASDVKSGYNIVAPTSKFAEVNEENILHSYENVVLSKEGYKITKDIVIPKDQPVILEETSNECNEAIKYVKPTLMEISRSTMTEDIAIPKDEPVVLEATRNECDEAKYVKRTRMDISRFTMTEDELLKDSEWFQPGFSREIAEMVLQNRSIGSFFIRDSISHPGNYVMTVKVPMHVKQNGVGNFLIDRLDDNYFKIKGFSLTFPSLIDLIAHYGSIQEDIPCQLRLANDNPLFMRRSYIDQPDAAKNNDISDAVFVSDDDEYDDPDYENFTCNDEIMKELALI